MPRMTQEQKRKGLIAKIHVAKNQMHMDDDVYRNLLQETTGKNSCTEMTLLELQRVIAKMERLGFKPTRKNLGAKPLHFTDVSELMNKLAVLLKLTEKSWEYANGMAKQMFQKEQVNQLDAVQLRKLVAALNIYHLKNQAAQAKKA